MKEYVFNKRGIHLHVCGVQVNERYAGWLGLLLLIYTKPNIIEGNPHKTSVQWKYDSGSQISKNKVEEGNSQQ